MDESDYGRILFRVTLGDLQERALWRIGRPLNEDEVYYAAKGIESGLGTSMYFVIDAAIDELTELPQSNGASLW